MSKSVKSCTPYETALSVNSKIVGIDSPFERFSRNANGDAKHAQRNLEQYWQSRKSLFGERCALPMNQSGHGTLSTADIEVLRSGFVVLLPKTKNDLPVVSFELSRLQDDFGDLMEIRESALRCIFYIYSVASEYTASQAIGVVTLVTICGDFAGLTGVGKEFVREALDIVENSLPLKLHRTDIIFRPPRKGKRDFLDRIIPPVVNVAQTYIKRGILSTQVAASTQQIANCLEQRGYVKESLPRILGGDWVHYTKFQDWRREREVSENAILHLNGLVKDTTQEQSSAKTAAAYIEQEAEKSKKRKTQAMYARRKRSKRRVAAENLRAHSESLEAENVVLKKKQAHLTSLLIQAERMVQVINATQTAEAHLPLSRAFGHGLETNQDQTIPRFTSPFNFDQAGFRGNQNSLPSTALPFTTSSRESPVHSSLSPSQLHSLQDMLRRHSYPLEQSNLLAHGLGSGSYDQQLIGRGDNNNSPRQLSQFGSLTGGIVQGPSGHREALQSQSQLLNSILKEAYYNSINNADVFTVSDVSRQPPRTSTGLSLLNQAIARQEQVSTLPLPLLENLLLTNRLQPTSDYQNIALRQLFSESATQAHGQLPQNQEVLNLILTLLGQNP